MNTNRVVLRLLGGKPDCAPVIDITHRPRPVGLTVAEQATYRRLRHRLTIDQAVDVVTGRASHGCTVGEAMVLRLVMPLDDGVGAVAA